MKKLNIVKTFMKKYSNNPYGIGANIVNMHKKYAEVLFDTSYDREKGKKILRKAGIPAKLMSNQMMPKGHKYRYCLNVWFD